MEPNLKTFQLTEDEISVLEDILFCENSKEWLTKTFSIRNNIWQKCLKQADFERELREEINIWDANKSDFIRGYIYAIEKILGEK